MLDAYHGACAAGLLLVALLVRVGVLLDLEGTLYFEGLTPDEDTYQRWATRIASGTDSTSFAPDFPRLPAQIFGAVYEVFGVDPQHLRNFNVILGTLLCALIYAITRVLYGKNAALVALALGALSESLAFYSATLLHTCLGLVLVGLLVLVIASCVQLPARAVAPRFLGAGALAGLLINVRGNAVVVALWMVPIAIQRARSGRSPWVGATLLALLGAGYVVAAGASGGLAGPRSAFNLYMGNNPDNPTPYFRPVRFTSSAPEYQTVGFVVEASRRAGYELSVAGAERFWIATVASSALAEPRATLAHLARKALAVLHSSPSDNNHDLRMFRERVPTLGIAWLPTWLLLALAVAGAAILPRDRRMAFGAAAFVSYAATLVVFFAGERLRVPLLVIALPFAAAAIVRLLESAAHERRARLLPFGVVVGLFALIAHLPLRGAGELSGPYNMHALLLLERHELEESARWYRRALLLDELDSPAARIGLASILQLRGELAQAVAVLRPVPDSHYEAASKQEWLGNLGLAQREPREAAQAYAKAIDFDASKQNAYKGLFIAYKMLGQSAKAQQIDDRLHALQERVRRIEAD